jgi:hypothetical protein
MAYDVAVAAKVQQSTREQGRQALQLIETAVAPTRQGASTPGIGDRLNVVA